MVEYEHHPTSKENDEFVIVKMTLFQLWNNHGLTKGPKAMILRRHSSEKRAVKTMFKYLSIAS